ncbi:MAG: hypothetical protein GXO93_03670 [FCB group bacterium]|nr:hypothetical protein [FCB group bacterium]
MTRKIFYFKKFEWYLFSLLTFFSVFSLAIQGKQNNWQEISSGSTKSSSTNYALAGSVGQAAVGISTSTNYNLNAGFWQNFGTGGCCVGIRGNVNGDSQNKININDIIYLINFAFLESPPPKCFEEADVNADGEINISDIIYLANYAFLGGPLPVSCP